MSAENPFRAALEWFGPNGERWEHGGPGDGRGSACSTVVIDKVIPGADEYVLRGDCWALLGDVARELFPDRVMRFVSARCGVEAVDVNDHPHTTFDDIRSLFEKCAIRWDEQEALR